MAVMGRRSVLGGAAAAAAAVATGARPTFAGGPRGLPNGSRGAGSATTQATIGTTLPDLAFGEQATYIPGAALVAGGTDPATPVGLVYDGTGAFPTSSGFLGTWVDAPIGSLITGADFVVSGTPLSGIVTIERYLPHAGGFDASVDNAPLTGSGTLVVSLTAGEVYDGTQAYHVYHYGGTATSLCLGIRVRHVPPSSGFVAITPVRAYDSRFDMAPDAEGRLASGASRTVHVSSKRNVDTGAIVDADAVPPARAVAYTVTLANTSGAGFLAVNPGGTTAVSASVINWSGAGQFPANSSIVKTGSDNTLTVVAGGAGSTDFVIDVIGYFTA
jgi:hypothetical protein